MSRVPISRDPSTSGGFPELSLLHVLRTAPLMASTMDSNQHKESREDATEDIHDGLLEEQAGPVESVKEDVSGTMDASTVHHAGQGSCNKSSRRCN